MSSTTETSLGVERVLGRRVEVDLLVRAEALVLEVPAREECAGRV
jgi:hypothetical protein